LEERVDRRQFFIGTTVALAFRSTLVAFQRYPRDNTSVDKEFADVLQRFQQDPELATSSRRSESRAFEPTEPGLERFERGPKSKRRISDRAVELIIAAEVTNKETYNSKYSSPVWPGLTSGITIGIGYDIGWVRQPDLVQDWKDYLDDQTIEVLSHATGKRGRIAAGMLDGFKAIKIGWDPASAQFASETLPRCIGETEKALPNTSALNNDCFGALVSIAYNRGPAFSESGDRYREMRGIHDYMSQNHFQGIPSEIRKMKRLWQCDPDAQGVVLRREAEALLFESGLRT
jgi:hypothetical protein